MKNSLLNIAVGMSALMCGLYGNAQNSPYITKVFDFVPAPGQFVNVLPEWNSGESKADILEKVQNQICGNDDDGVCPGMISLGAYGGYVVFGFDHTIVNVAGEYDFKIYGNAINNGSEPGIIMVSYDANKNGEPDDEWYQIAGSEYNNALTNNNYEITYYKPDANRDVNADPDSSNSAITDCTYIKWTSNTGETGYVMRNSYHLQSYWPEWETGDKLVFKGSCLPDNAQETSGTGTNFVLSAYDFGYVDNVPNIKESGVKIEWAVDENGNSVNLPGINFVKVYTAINQYCGWIGETSTEVCGGEDLHPNVSGISAVTAGGKDITLRNKYVSDELFVTSRIPAVANIFNMSGLLVNKINLIEGTNSIDVSNISSGMYILNANGVSYKFIKK